MEWGLSPSQTKHKYMMNLQLQIRRATMLGMLLLGIAITTNAQRQRSKAVKKQVPVLGRHVITTAEDLFVADLLRKMTLEEKVGQLSQYVGGSLLTGPKSGALSDSLMARGMVGSILNVGGVDNLRKLQEKNMRLSRLKIPLIFGFDVVHGYKTIFPTPLAESCSWDLDLMYRTAKAAAIEASASGIHWTFAPMVDLARDPRWGRIVEGAGEDPFFGCKVAEARVKGFQWNLGKPNSVLACAKHFAAYGAPQAGRDYAPVDISPATLAEMYLPPFKACIDAGVQTFMSAFNDLNGEPATGSHWLLTDLLRNQWAFKGFVVSDWNAVVQLKAQGVVENDRDAAIMALKAGVDMDMVDGLYNAHIADAVRKGLISEFTVNTAVERILRQKYRLGLFDNPYAFLDKAREQQTVRSAELMVLAREAATKSMVLLKNEGGVLPLSKQVRRIAVIGPLADNQAEVLGSWKARGEDADVVTVVKGMRNKLGTNANVVYVRGCDFLDTKNNEFAKARQAAANADVVIAVVGEKALMSGESRSRAFLSLPGLQQQLIDTLKSTGKPLVTVLMNGRPLTLARVAEQSDALLEAWFPGTQCGNAVADVLFGDVNPSGKLTVSFPYAEGQIPNYYNYRRSGRPGDMEQTSTVRHIDLKNRNLYPFGFGLSYTTFEYGPIECASHFDANGRLKVSVDVKNTGNRDGEEIVQLYVADKVASMVRPVKELKGFKKVMIRRGETQRVDFELHVHDLGFYTNTMKYVVEPGEFDIMVGPNSEQLNGKTVVWNK